MNNETTKATPARMYILQNMGPAGDSFVYVRGLYSSLDKAEEEYRKDFRSMWSTGDRSPFIVEISVDDPDCRRDYDLYTIIPQKCEEDTLVLKACRYRYQTLARKYPENVQSGQEPDFLKDRGRLVFAEDPERALRRFLAQQARKGTYSGDHWGWY